MILGPQSERRLAANSPAASPRCPLAANLALLDVLRTGRCGPASESAGRSGAERPGR